MSNFQDLRWLFASDQLPEPGKWVLVWNLNNQGKGEIFPAVLVKTHHGNMWRDLSILDEDVIPYAAVAPMCRWISD